MATGTKIEGLADVKGWAKKFEQNKLNNATGARTGVYTEADAALATHNNNRGGLYFDGFQAKIIEAQATKKVQEDASLTLALKLQREDEAALRKEQEEAASLRLAQELDAQERGSESNYRF